MRNDLATGAKFLFSGFALLKRPKIKRFVIIPLCLNIILFTGMMFIAMHFFGELNQWLLTKLPSWLQWLSYIMWIFFGLGFLFVAGFTFTTVASIVGAPFNALLAEQVELILTGNAPPSSRETMLTTVKDVPRILKRQMSILAYFIPRAAVLLILFVIPFVSIIASPCWFIFSAWSISLQYMDYPMDNHKIPLPMMRHRARDKRWTSLGFGLITMLLTLIPIVNFFVMPAAVAGATLMFIEAQKDNPLPVTKLNDMS